MSSVVPTGEVDSIITRFSSSKRCEIALTALKTYDKSGSLLLSNGVGTAIIKISALLGISLLLICWF